MHEMTIKVYLQTYIFYNNVQALYFYQNTRWSHIDNCFFTKLLMFKMSDSVKLVVVVSHGYK